MRAGRSIVRIPRLLGVVAGLLAAATVEAAVLSYDYDIPSEATGWSETIQVQKYDGTGYGPLQGISFSYSGFISGSLGVENLEDKFNFVSGRLVVDFLIQRPDNSTLLALQVARTNDAIFEPFDFALDYGGTSGATYNSPDANGYGEVTGTAEDMALFTGAGTVAIHFQASDSSYAVAGEGTPAFQVSSFGGGTFTINYHFAPIPEPGSMVLIGATGVLLWRYRRLMRFGESTDRNDARRTPVRVAFKGKA